MHSKYNKLSFFFLILIFFSYFFGFYFNEDSSGGGKIDFIHIYKNFILFKTSSILEINWALYESSSLPIYYLIIKYLIPLNNVFIFKLFNFIFSLSVVFILYFTIKFKYNLKVHNINLFLISSLILLSPYYRTSAFYGLEENICYLFLTISTFFYYYPKKSIIFKVTSIFFACLCFYGRQYYVFFTIIIFFLLIDLNKIFSKRNVIIFYSFFIFLIPSLYFFNSWEGLTSPAAQVGRVTKFRLDNILKILSIIFVYLLPFFLFYIKQNYKLLIKYFFILIILWLLFLLFFFNLPLTHQNIGGGAIFKLYIINNQSSLMKILFLTSAFISLLSTIYICYKNYILAIYFITMIFLLSFVDIVFQEYFDPLTYLMILLFADTEKYFQKEDANKFSFFLLSYFFIFFVSSIIYHNTY